MDNNFVIRGDLCYCADDGALHTLPGGYLACENGESLGVFSALPERFKDWPLRDYGGMLVIPGLVDLHIHAPQYAFRGLGMDLELLDWLNTRTFPQEARYRDLAYADRAYTAFVEALRRGPQHPRLCFRHAAPGEHPPADGQAGDVGPHHPGGQGEHGPQQPAGSV